MRTVHAVVLCLAIVCVIPGWVNGDGDAKKNAKAPVQAAASAGSEGTDTLVVVARVAEIPGKFAPNDLYNYVYIMKYQIVKVEKGSYAGKEILIGHYNPLIPRAKIKDKMDPVVNGNADKFTVGVKQRLVLITPIETVWNDAIDDEYFDSELDKYFAIKTDNVE
jgi:hypothetical protein